MDVDMIHGPNLDSMVLTETDLENIEKSVKEFENLEMDDEMIANDDLLGDAPGFDAVQIDALTQLSPVHTEIQDPQHDIPVSSTPERRSADYASLPQRTNIDTVMSHDGTASKLPVTQTRKPAGVLKRNVPKSPDAKAARASRKLNAARGRTSPKVKKGNTSSTNLPTTAPGGDTSTQEKAKDAQTYDMEDIDSEPEPDKEASDGAARTESPMIGHLHQMFSDRLDAMQSMGAHTKPHSKVAPLGFYGGDRQRLRNTSEGGRGTSKLMQRRL
ncbi:hypothetical protein Bca52824_082057 [Brassica carinata]|uniref:Uncharacterized protein n=1 Tax=Brassica carinata TaxID=52824 RepID=A0A8X7PHI0_BRACI|nr:hypothetical protein Bca52824_082057 [Brassica carinata]